MIWGFFLGFFLGFFGFGDWGLRFVTEAVKRCGDEGEGWRRREDSGGGWEDGCREAILHNL